MKSTRQFAGTGLILLIVMLMLLVACSTQSDTTTEKLQSSTTSEETSTEVKEVDIEEAAEQAQFPITIKHGHGETVINSKPERVATIAWANHDVALALGVVPVGFSATNYGVQDDSGLLPWTAKKLEELGVTAPNVFQDTDGLDYEAIADSNPDIILAAYSGITKEEYETLSKIAPVVAYPAQPWVITWREQVLFNAEGIGMKAEGEQLIKDIEQLIADKAAQFPQIKGVKAAFTYFSASDLSSYYIYSTTDPRAEFLLELGMEYPESVNKLITPETGFALTLSSENADALYGADIIVGYGDDTLLEALRKDPVFSKIPAVERGSMVLIPDNTPLAAAGNPNPLSIQYTIDEYVDLIVEAIAKINE